MARNQDLDEVRTIGAGCGNDARPGTLTISCDDCSMQHTHVCSDCVVSFVLGELDDDAARVVQLFGAAGMVPELRYQRAGP